MSALPTKHDEETNTFFFEQNQAIPSYLLAIAVGHLVSADLSERIRVWTEPSMIEKCRYEFEQSEAFLTKAEELLGKYQWKRYDFLVLPPSFPCKWPDTASLRSIGGISSRWWNGKSLYELSHADVTRRRSIVDQYHRSRNDAFLDRSVCLSVSLHSSDGLI